MTGKNKERGRGGAMNTSALSRPLPPPSTLQTKHGTIDYTSVNFITLTRFNETPALQVMLHFVVFTGLKVNAVNSVTIITRIRVASVFQVNEKARLAKNLNNIYSLVTRCVWKYCRKWPSGEHRSFDHFTEGKQSFSEETAGGGKKKSKFNGFRGNKDTDIACDKRNRS